jgi:magnesium chelatase family protein
VPAFVIVGLPDKAVAESRERVRAAIAAIGLALPPKRIIREPVARRPAQGGIAFRSAVALALLGAMGVVDAETLAGYVVVGELGLDGRIAPSPGVLLAAMHASERSARG